MESISNDTKSNNINIDNFFEVSKVIIYSIIGIVIFFIPISIDNQTKTILNHMAYRLQINYGDILKICTVIYIILGVTKSILSKNKSSIQIIYSYLKVFSIFIVISLFYSKYSIVLLDDNIAFILEEMILNLITALPLSAVFLPFILDFGLLEIVEGFTNKFMKKLFNLSGKTILNILMYLFNNCFCGYFMTELLYEKGKIRQKEACIIILNFSIASISVSTYIAEELKINKVNFFILSVFILFLTNLILCRIYPINKKKKSYYIKTSYKETNFKNDKLKSSIKKYVQNKEDINIFKSMFGNLEKSIHILITVIPNLVLVMYLGNIIINNMDAVYNFKVVFLRILEFLNFNNINEMGIFFINGLFNDVVAIDTLNTNIDYTSRLLIGVICILKCTSITTNILYVGNSEIPVNKVDFLVSYIQRIVVILLISSMIFYLYNIYTI